MCRIIYRRIVETPDEATVQSTSSEEAGLGPAHFETSSQDDPVDEEMYHYTRVQILTQKYLSSYRELGWVEKSNGVRELTLNFATLFWVCGNCFHFSSRTMSPQECCYCGHRLCDCCERLTS